jgi:hypothetical protein
MKKIRVFLSLSFLLIAAVAKAVDEPPTVFTVNGHTLQKNKARIAAKDLALLPAYNNLIKEADEALKERPFSVIEKKQAPPSGDKHDFMSLAPYFWPDPSKPNGLPYMRKDGQTNPEVADYSDKQYLPKLIKLVTALSQAYYFSGN